MHEENKSLQKVIEYAKEFLSYSPTNYIAPLKGISNELKRLNENLENSNKSSEKLTSALNKITIAGVVISGIALLVEIIKLIL